jgi:hypothetical protein
MRRFETFGSAYSAGVVPSLSDGRAANDASSRWDVTALQNSLRIDTPRLSRLQPPAIACAQEAPSVIFLGTAAAMVRILPRSPPGRFVSGGPFLFPVPLDRNTSQVGSVEHRARQTRKDQ